MKPFKLRAVIFLALCCDLGLFAKKIINPFANVVTDALHIPGGISTAFSLMFLAIAASIVQKPWCGAVMGLVQSVLALAFGMVGSMGALSPVVYILPGAAIDAVLRLTRRGPFSHTDRMVLATMAAAVCASLSANFIVFRLRGVVLLLYLCISAVSGSVCGWLGAEVSRRLIPIVGAGFNRKNRSDGD